MLRSPQCSSGAGPALWTETGQDFVFLAEDPLRSHHLVPAAPPTKGYLHQYIQYQASFSLLSVVTMSLINAEEFTRNPQEYPAGTE